MAELQSRIKLQTKKTSRLFPLRASDVTPPSPRLTIVDSTRIGLTAEIRSAVSPLSARQLITSSRLSPLHSATMQLVCVHAGAGYHAARNHDALKAAMKAACRAAMQQQEDGMQACVDAIKSVNAAWTSALQSNGS